MSAMTWSNSADIRSNKKQYNRATALSKERIMYFFDIIALIRSNKNASKSRLAENGSYKVHYLAKLSKII